MGAFSLIVVINLLNRYKMDGAAPKSQQKDFADFNFDKLERELEATVAAEKQYWLENDAKIRAVKQGVPTYDHFREMVMGANLKPLEKGEKVDSAYTRSRNQPWNMHACASSASGETSKQDLSCTAVSNPSVELPSNHAAFNLQWKRCGDDQRLKYQFLMRYPKEGVSLAQVFKTDLPSNLFTDCCKVMHDFLSADDEKLIVQILEDFSTSKRFKLTIDFLSKDEKTILYNLFGKLNSESVNNQMKELYKVV